MRAQLNVGSPINFISHPLLFVNTAPGLAATDFVMFQTPILQKQPLQISSGYINDLPFFCAMECKVRQHTNIWIKLRAGNDESYMKMISPSK